MPFWCEIFSGKAMPPGREPHRLWLTGGSCISPAMGNLKEAFPLTLSSVSSLRPLPRPSHFSSFLYLISPLVTLSRTGDFHVFFLQLGPRGVMRGVSVPDTPAAVWGTQTGLHSELQLFDPKAEISPLSEARWL